MWIYLALAAKRGKKTCSPQFLVAHPDGIKQLSLAIPSGAQCGDGGDGEGQDSSLASPSPANPGVSARCWQFPEKPPNREGQFPPPYSTRADTRYSPPVR